MPRQTSFSRIACVLLLALVWSLVESPSRAASDVGVPVSFSRDVAPILRSKCITCHNAEKAKGGYRLHTFEALMKAGDGAEAPVVAGASAKSRLYQLLVTGDADERMPQKDDPLPAGQVALIARWIEQGAKFDGADAKATLESLAGRKPHPEPPPKYLRPVPVLALAFNRDGSEIAASGYNEVTFWSATNGSLVRRVKNLPQQVQAVAYSPSSNLVAVCGGTPGVSGEVALIDPAGSVPSRVLATAPDLFLSLAFSPDGRFLLAGGSDNTIRVFEMDAGGREKHRLEVHADWVLGLTFAPDGKHFASASRDKTARLFSAGSWELEETYDGHAQPVFAVAISRDGKRVFSGARDREVHAWTVAEAKKVFEVGGFGSDVTRLLCVEDVLFSVSMDRIVRHYRIVGKQAELVRAYPAAADVAYSMAHHAAANRLATGSHDGVVRVFDSTSGELQFDFIAAPSLSRAAR